MKFFRNKDITIVDPFASSPDQPSDHFNKHDEQGLFNSSESRELPAELEEVINQEIRPALKGLQFGEVTITVLNGRRVADSDTYSAMAREPGIFTRANSNHVPFRTRATS